ncbi:hypothetical protein M3Y98_01004900 [Aphelenchoides besseyi]|nr:hypothetical protein M3Y98_01004900 [Aphelenchoides besseyi]
MSTILPIIEKIRREKRYCDVFAQQVSILHNHVCDFDDVCRVIYNSAEVHPDCLDRGSGKTNYTASCLGREGSPGDGAFQLINKRLVDLTAWKKNETTIHEHVKKGGNRHALMVFAAEYDDDNEFEI